MLTPVRRAPASIEKPPEPVRGQASRLPWVWDSLCFAVPFDIATRDSARDMVTNHAPSTVSGLTWTRDYGGNVAANLGATSYIDYPDDPVQRKPSTAMTAYVRFRRAGTGNPSGGLFTRRHSASDPWVSWCIQHADAGDNTLAGNITVSGTSNYWEAFDYTTNTTEYVSAFMRWRTGSPPVLDVLSERGRTLSTNFYASNLSGTITYVTGEPMRLNAVQDTTLNFNADYSQAMLWSRRLTDRELNALVSDPFGWYSPRRETLVIAGSYPVVGAPLLRTVSW
jgi:hypothetical protein